MQQSTDDEMVSWLHLVDPNYVSQPFGDVVAPRTHITREVLIQRMHDQNFPVSGNDAMDMHKQRAESSNAALTLAAGRAAGILQQVGYEAFDKPRTVSQPCSRKWCHPQQESSEASAAKDTTVMGPPTSAGGAVNFPQFALATKLKAKACVATTKPVHVQDTVHVADTEMDSSRSTVDCRSISSIQPPWSCTQTRTEDMSLGETSERNWSHDTNTKYSEPVESMKTSQQRTSQATIETFTSSSGGSGNSDKAEREVHLGLKRKERDVEDTANCQVKNITGSVPVETRKTSGRGTSSKRTRAAEVHNLSERRRRDRINERMKALQELIPNSSKTDKASMLDEAIEYLKTLQFQLQMMSMRSGLSMSPMIVPTGMPPMQMPHHMQAYGVNMGMGMGMRWMLPHSGASLISSSAGNAPHFSQGMSMEMYNHFMLQQQQEQQQQQQQQQQQYEH